MGHQRLARVGRFPQHLAVVRIDGEEALRDQLHDLFLAGVLHEDRGGILGVIGGALISYSLPLFGFSLGFGPGRGEGGIKTVLNPSLIIFSLFFSILIGMV